MYKCDKIILNYINIERYIFKMKENKYDDINFFNAYKQMARSVKGLEGAG